MPLAHRRSATQCQNVDDDIPLSRRQRLELWNDLLGDALYVLRVRPIGCRRRHRVRDHYVNFVTVTEHAVQLFSDHFRRAEERERIGDIIG